MKDQQLEQNTLAEAAKPSNETHHKVHKLSRIFVIFSALIGIATSIYFFYFYFIYQPPESPLLISRDQTRTVDDMANWKTYTNNQYNFSINYPASWIIDDSTARIYIKSPDLRHSDPISSYTIVRGAILTIEPSLRSGVDIQEVISARLYDCAKKTFKENLIVDGHKAQRYETYCPGQEPNAQTIFIDKNTQIYVFDFNYVANNTTNFPQLFDQILSTFKFTE